MEFFARLRTPTDRLEREASLKTSVKPLYVRTDDFRLAHRLLSEFNQRNLPAKQISLTQPVEHGAYWFGTPDEVASMGGRGVAVDVNAVSSAVSTWLLSRQLEAPPKQLVVGVDPGPRPGFAFLADGVVLGKREMDAIDDAIDATVQLVTRVKPMQVLVRIGHGSPVHRDRLVNRMLSMGYHVEIVNEHRTSSGQPRHAHGAAAIKIAMLAGKPIHEQRSVQVTDGELRNLQRISRQRSKGRLTLSLEAARRVACGEVTLDEALEEAGHDASSS